MIPRDVIKLDRLQKKYKISWNDLPPHQQSSHEVELHWSIDQHAQPLEKIVVVVVIMATLHNRCGHYTLWNIKNMAVNLCQ